MAYTNVSVCVFSTEMKAATHTNMIHANTHTHVRNFLKKCLIRMVPESISTFDLCVIFILVCRWTNTNVSHLSP